MRPFVDDRPFVLVRPLTSDRPFTFMSPLVMVRPFVIVRPLRNARPLSVDSEAPSRNDVLSSPASSPQPTRPTIAPIAKVTCTVSFSFLSMMRAPPIKRPRGGYLHGQCQ